MSAEPGIVRYVLIAGLLIFGATGVALYFHEQERPHRVIREALRVAPPELQQQQQQEPEPAKPETAADRNKKLLKGMDSLAGRMDRVLKTAPKFSGR
jgi:hypothetical protein